MAGKGKSMAPARTTVTLPGHPAVPPAPVAAQVPVEEPVVVPDEEEVVLDDEEEEEVTTASVAAVYTSIYPQLIIVIEPADKQVLYGQVHSIKGRRIQFDNGNYTTSDPSEIAAIERSKFFARGFIKRVANIDTVKTVLAAAAHGGTK